MLLLEALGENPSLPFPRDSGGCWKFVAFLALYVRYPSPCLHLPFPVLFSVSSHDFLIKKGVTGSGAHPNPVVISF